ncbi:MAG: hypothetical protein U9N00_02135 [Candidatus Bipolaricaulota bacterium]|nr:hypothetical protein [Candidatus Bipolaricaulota bacterium]
MAAKKIRKQIYIEARQEKLLKQLVKETGATEAELIRQAIDRHTGSFSPRYDMRAWEEERAFIEKLMQEGPVPGGLTWKREEIHE